MMVPIIAPTMSSRSESTVAAPLAEAPCAVVGDIKAGTVRVCWGEEGKGHIRLIRIHLLSMYIHACGVREKFSHVSFFFNP